MSSTRVLNQRSRSQDTAAPARPMGMVVAHMTVVSCVMSLEVDVALPGSVPAHHQEAEPEPHVIPPPHCALQCVLISTSGGAITGKQMNVQALRLVEPSLASSDALARDGACAR